MEEVWKQYTAFSAPYRGLYPTVPKTLPLQCHAVWFQKRPCHLSTLNEPGSVHGSSSQKLYGLVEWCVGIQQHIRRSYAPLCSSILRGTIFVSQLKSVSSEQQNSISLVTPAMDYTPNLWRKTLHKSASWSSHAHVRNGAASWGHATGCAIISRISPSFPHRWQTCSRIQSVSRRQAQTSL